jgi:hypothetical protein
MGRHEGQGVEYLIPLLYSTPVRCWEASLQDILEYFPLNCVINWQQVSVGKAGAPPPGKGGKGGATVG